MSLGLVDLARQLATWLVASFLLYTLASQIAWQYRYAGRDDFMGRWIDRMRGHNFAPWAEEALRFVYYLGIPFMAAISGLLGADLLGIRGTDWASPGGEASLQGFLWKDWTRGLGLAVTAALVTWGTWFVGRSLSRRRDLAAASPGLPGPAWQRLLSALYDQVHWAFYRSGPILWLDDFYGGIFAGLALVLLEAALNPAHRWALKEPETAGPLLTRLSLAWMSALLFFATHNFWLPLAVHLLLVGLWGGVESPSYPYADEAA